MGHPDENAPEYCSMDVDAYGSAVDDLESTHSGIADHVLGLETDFTYFGVSTTNFNKLKEAKTDLDDVMPGLRRRHSLALQLLEEQQEQGWGADGTISFQGDILNDDFESVEDAQQAGEEAAGQVPGDGSEIPQEVYDQLEEHGHDPDFAEAFINALSPEQRALLLNDADSQNLDGNEGPQLALSTTFATASFRIDYDAEFIQEMNDAMLDLGAHPEGIRMIDKMAALMQNGTWSYESVLAFSEAALAEGATDDLGQVNDWAAVIAALARNPRASAEYMHRNPEAVWEQSNVLGPVTDTPEWQEAWAAFIKSATVDSRTIYDRIALYDDGQVNLAEQNAAYLITQIGTQPAGEEFPFSEEMRSVFADITEEYWDEYIEVFTNPAGVATLPDGTPIPIDHVNPEAWDAFITEAMRSEEGSARMFELYHNQVEEMREGRTGDSDASGWDGYMIGRLRNTFLANWNQILDERGADAEARKEARDGMIDWLIEAGFDPKGTAEDLASLPADVAKGIIGELLKGFADDLTEEQMQELETELLGDYQAWMSNAGVRYNEGEIEPYDDGTVTWDGDPEFYEEHYGGEFTDANGKILPLEEIRNDPAALDAYNAWLQDPAVQKATNPFFQDENPDTGG